MLYNQSYKPIFRNTYIPFLRIVYKYTGTRHIVKLGTQFSSRFQQYYILGKSQLIVIFNS